MRDRRIREHALDVGLRDRNDVAERQRQYRHDQQHLVPLFVQQRHAVDKDAGRQRKRRDL